MQDASETQPPRIKWKPWHFLLMLVPGVIFLVMYPTHHKEELERAVREITRNPFGGYHPSSMPAYCAFVAGVRSGMYMVTAMMLCAALLSLNQPTRRQTVCRLLFALAFMASVNVVLCSGGCALGNYRTRELQAVVMRIKRAPAPEPSDSIPRTEQQP